MQIFLVRHIKTTAPDGLCYGQSDLALPSDYQQAHQEIARQLKNHTFDGIWSSPLTRCSLLAKTIAQDHLLKVQYDVRLKELNFGNWEQKMWSDIETTAEAKKIFNDYLHVKAPNGESFSDLISRVSSFIEALNRCQQYKKVLIVTHAGPIRVIHGLLKQLKPEDFFNYNPGYGEISEIELYEKQEL